MPCLALPASRGVHLISKRHGHLVSFLCKKNKVLGGNLPHCIENSGYIKSLRTGRTRIVDAAPTMKNRARAHTAFLCVSWRSHTDFASVLDRVFPFQIIPPPPPSVQQGYIFETWHGPNPSYQQNQLWCVISEFSRTLWRAVHYDLIPFLLYS